MKFGINPIRKLTGAELSVRILQIAAILPAVYMFMVSGYHSLVTRQNLFSVLFNVGICTLPKLETLGLSALYRLALSEVALCFTALGFALVFGLVAKPLLRGDHKRAVISRIVFAVLVFADLIIRLLPLKMNTVFGIVPEVIGFMIRLGCLVMIILDLVADKREQKKEAEA
ncbi:MAG: hypothetical protein IKO51_07220 [Clostridia bacterium]|nr:hypothetical protein [Clostridia bacterium]